VALGDPVVLEDGDTRLAGIDRDEELALRLRERCALRGLPTLLLAPLRGLSLRLLRLLLRGRERCGADGPLAATAASRAAAALLLCCGLDSVARRTLGRLDDDGCFRFWIGSGGRGRRRLLRLLPAEQGQWQRWSPSM